jgi:hypothetical protein
VSEIERKEAEMIFLSLAIAGTIAGIAVHLWLTRAASLADVAQGGTAGAFLIGGIAAGIANRDVGPFDPIALAVGLAGAIGVALTIEWLADLKGRAGSGSRRRG